MHIDISIGPTGSPTRFRIEVPEAGTEVRLSFEAPGMHKSSTFFLDPVLAMSLSAALDSAAGVVERNITLRDIDRDRDACPICDGTSRGPDGEPCRYCGGD